MEKSSSGEWSELARVEHPLDREREEGEWGLELRARGARGESEWGARERGVEVSEWRVGGRARRCTGERGEGEWWEGEEGGEEGEWWASGGAREWARGGASRGRDGVPPLSESFLLW